MTKAKQRGRQPSRGSKRDHQARSETRRHGGSPWFAFGLLALAMILIPTRLSTAAKPEVGPQAGGQLDCPPPLSLTIRVYNYALVPAGNLRRAQSEASGIIGDTGVETVWLACPTSRLVSLAAQGGSQQDCSGQAVGATVILRVLNRSEYNTAAFKGDVFGYADAPALASVVYDRVADLANADGDPNEAPVILGDAMAHEIGHLLLGPRAHSSTGIMRGQWDRSQLQRALTGRQRFTPEQSARIRAATEARMKL